MSKKIKKLKNKITNLADFIDLEMDRLAEMREHLVNICKHKNVLTIEIAPMDSQVSTITKSICEDCEKDLGTKINYENEN